jgi:hypothetical protein
MVGLDGGGMCLSMIIILSSTVWMFSMMLLLLCCTQRAGHCRSAVTSVESVVENGSEFSGVNGGILPSSFLDFCSFSRVMFDGGRCAVAISYALSIPTDQADREKTNQLYYFSRSR